jgi:hypothetical protein
MWGRGDVAQALWNYYGDPGMQGGGAYRVRVGDRDVLTSIITRPQWLDLKCLLTPVHDRLTLAGSSTGWQAEVDDFAAKCAVRRLKEVIALNVRLTNAPIYRLLNFDVSWAAPCIPVRDRELLAELIADKRWSNEGVVRADQRPNKGSDALRPSQLI